MGEIPPAASERDEVMPAEGALGGFGHDMVGPRELACRVDHRAATKASQRPPYLL
jgi:hypothetical protein